MGQLPSMHLPALPSAVPPNQCAFYYMDAVGGPGYDIGDPVYLKVQSPTAPFAPIIVGTNDIRIIANAGFPAGSRVSNNDQDAARPLTAFGPVVAIPAAGGPIPTFPPAQGTVAAITFFNANGNIISITAPSQAIYDEGDVAYFEVNPFGTVSPNDIRLY